MRNIKNVIYKGIIEEKEKNAQKYINKLNELENINDIANLYTLINEVYQDGEAKEDMIIQLMNMTLTNEFFREALIEREDNNIIFYDVEYKIKFPLSKRKIIFIEYISTTNPAKYINIMTEKEEASKHTLSRLIECYLNDKTFSNLKSLANVYVDKENLGFFRKLIKTHKECNEDKLNILNVEFKVNEEREALFRESTKIYEVEKLAAIDFLSSLTDLQVYKDAGWEIIIQEQNMKKVINTPNA